MNKDSQKRNQNGKSPIGPGETQIRGFRGMPTPEEVGDVAQAPTVKKASRITPEQEISPKTPTPTKAVSEPQTTKKPIPVVLPQSKPAPQVQKINPSTPQSQPRNPKPYEATAKYAQGLSQAPEKVVDKKARSTVRTFKGDATAYIKEENITETQIALAEQKRRHAEGTDVQVQPQTSKKIWIILLTTLFLLVGIAVFAFVYFKPDISFLGISQNPEVTIPQQALDSLTGNKKAQYLPLDTSLPYEEIDSFFDRLLRLDDAAYLFVEETFDGREEIILPEAFFFYTRIYDLQDISFAFKNLEYGVQGGSPYLLLEASDFPKVYPRIFTWEEQMVAQVEPLFPELRKREMVVTSSGASEIENIQNKISEERESLSDSEDAIIGLEEVEEDTTDSEVVMEEVLTNELISEENIEAAEVPEVNLSDKTESVIQEKIIIDYQRDSFRDALYENQSIRVILNEDGQSVLYHTFINDQYVLISQDLDIIPLMLKALR